MCSISLTGTGSRISIAEAELYVVPGKQHAAGMDQTRFPVPSAPARLGLAKLIYHANKSHPEATWKDDDSENENKNENDEGDEGA